MPKREEQLTRAMVGRVAVQKRLTDDEIIELERREREQRALKRKFAEGTGEVVKEQYISKAQQKKDKIASREAELLLNLQQEEEANRSESSTGQYRSVST